MARARAPAPKEQTKGERTRQRLVEAAAALLQRQGFHATGLAEIVAESGAPRGSLYFHFPGGKEELACAALEASGARWREVLEAVIGAAADPGEAVAAACRFLGEGLAASGYVEGCPLATVGLEASASSEPVRATIARHYDAWIERIEARFVAAGGELRGARRLATFTLSAIEGALLLAKVQRSSRPLVDVGETLRAMVTLALTGPAKGGRRPGRGRPRRVR